MVVSSRKRMMFGWSIFSLITLTCARAITVPTSPVVSLNRKKICGPRQVSSNDTTKTCRDRDERYHGTDILDPSKSLDERFPIRGGGTGSTTTATTVVTEKAWVDGAKNSLASALAAAFSKTILAPFDTIKTLQQYHQSSPNAASLSLMEASRLILERPGGFLNFYVRYFVFAFMAILCF